MNEEVMHLLETVADAHPKFNAEFLEREKLFKLVFPKTKFDMQRLRYLATDLVRLAERFLTIREMERSDFVKRELLLSALADRHLDKLFESCIQSLKKSQVDKRETDFKVLLENYLVEEREYMFMNTRKNRVVETNLPQVLSNLDLFYINTKLKYCCELVNRSNVVASDYSIDLLEEILAHLDKSDYSTVPSISIYKLILLTLIEPENQEHYFKLMGLLMGHESRFMIDELRDMYLFAQNYCIKKINSGHPEFLEELFEIYKLLLDNGGLPDSKYLSPQHFKNIVNVGLRLGKLEWVHDFINEFHVKISPAMRENAFTYNMALYHFHLKEYDKTLELLHQVELTDVFYAVDCRFMLLRTYYELDEVDPLLSLMDAFKVYLRRNKSISEYQKTISKNLLKFVNRLVKLPPKDPKKLNKLKQEIEQTMEIANREWLKEKVHELENQYA